MTILMRYLMNRHGLYPFTVDQNRLALNFIKRDIACFHKLFLSVGIVVVNIAKTFGRVGKIWRFLLIE